MVGNTQMVKLGIVPDGMVCGRWINGPPGNRIEHVIEQYFKLWYIFCSMDSLLLPTNSVSPSLYIELCT